MENWEDKEALLFHALLLVPRQDRRYEWSHDTKAPTFPSRGWMEKHSLTHHLSESKLLRHRPTLREHQGPSDTAIPCPPSPAAHPVPPTQPAVLERDGALLSRSGLHSLAVLPISSARSQQAGSSSGALPWLDLCYAHVTLWLWQTSGSGLPPLRVTALGGRGGEAGASVVSDPTHDSLCLSVCQASCPPSPGTAADQLKAARERPRLLFQELPLARGWVPASSMLGPRGREQGHGWAPVTARHARPRRGSARGGRERPVRGARTAARGTGSRRPTAVGHGKGAAPQPGRGQAQGCQSHARQGMDNGGSPRLQRGSGTG